MPLGRGIYIFSPCYDIQSHVTRDVISCFLCNRGYKIVWGDKMSKKTSIQNDSYDFHPLGQAIRDGRDKQKITREALAEKIGLTDRYLAQVENEGQHPSLQVLYELVTMFDVSVDQYFYPNCAPTKSTRRRQLETLMDKFDESDLIILEATANGIMKAKTTYVSDESSLTYTLTSEKI